MGFNVVEIGVNEVQLRPITLTNAVEKLLRLAIQR